MLILVKNGQKPKGFWLKHKAKQGKLPPTVEGLQLGGYPCVLLGLYGTLTPNHPFLAPYFRRGDVVIGAQRLEFHTPYLEEFTRRQCVNTAKQWVATKPKGFEVAVVDPTGECPGVVAEFCALGHPVWAVTPKRECYTPCQEYCLLEFGNPPMIGNRIPPCVNLVVAPYGVSFGEIPHKVPVVAPGHIWANANQLHVPTIITNTTPTGFDPLLVAAGCFCAFGVGMECEARLYSDIFAFGKSDMLPTQRDIFPTEM